MVASNHIVTEEPVVAPEKQYQATPEEKLQKAIYILENGDPDYNLITRYFHKPGEGYCVQGLLLELSGVGYWKHTGALGCFYTVADDEYKHLGDYSGFRILANYYSLGNQKSGEFSESYLTVDDSKLPEDSQMYFKEIAEEAARRRQPLSYGSYHLATINNVGLEMKHPQIRKVLADILRYNAFK